MSEKIYAWLLRLYPSNFQKAYGEEALQLFRDRARDERGFPSGLRLWLDLLSDLIISMPRWSRTVPAALVASRGEHCADGTPSFQILEDEALSFGSLLYGGIASLVVYGFILLLIGHGGNPIPIPIPAPSIQQFPRDSGAIANPFATPASEIQRSPAYSGTIAKPTPTVALSYLPTNPTSRSMVILTARVLAVGAGPTPTGEVRFFDGSTVLNMGKLNSGTVTVKGTLPQIATHSVSAIYYGDATYSPANSVGERW